MSKSFSLALILILAFSSLLVIFNTPLGLAQSGTNENGIITSDTTWTKGNSLYNLQGPVAVNPGVILKIEPGVNINLNNYYIVVNGTLSAVGNPTTNIIFNGGIIYFNPSSTSWDEQKSSGCIIENSVINSGIQIGLYALASASPKISHNTINGSILCNQGSPIIENNVIMNRVGPAAIDVGRGSPLIMNNVIMGSNYESDIGILSEGDSIIQNNTLLGQQKGTGISISGIGNASVFDNNISGFQVGINTASFGLVQKNYIFNNYIGIETRVTFTDIQNNTITGNTRGIFAYYGPTIIYNNILNSTEANFYSFDSDNVTAIYNWWGTTDQQAISQTIHDNKNDFNLGIVNFVPFLTAPNPQAPTAPTSTPTPSTSQTPSPSPTVPEFTTLVMLPLILSMLFIAVKLRYRKTINLTQ